MTSQQYAAKIVAELTQKRIPCNQDVIDNAISGHIPVDHIILTIYAGTGKEQSFVYILTNKSLIIINLKAEADNNDAESLLLSEIALVGVKGVKDCPNDTIFIVKTSAPKVRLRCVQNELVPFFHKVKSAWQSANPKQAPQSPPGSIHGR